jgi:hypothetical protein
MSGQYPYQGSGQDQSGGYYATTSGGYDGYYGYDQYPAEQPQQNQPEACEFPKFYFNYDSISTLLS